MNEESKAYQEAVRRIRTWSLDDGYLDLAINHLLVIPETISNLAHLTDLRLYVFDKTHRYYASVCSLSPLVSLARLVRLDICHTQISDLLPISKLTTMQMLNCNFTQVSDLSPLSNLSKLKTLDCSMTSISDLSPLSNLSKLETLDCGNTSISDLSPLSSLSKLETLDCSMTSISDLSPLSNLNLLKSLDCSNTSISEFSPLSHLTTLRTLHCYSKSISDFSSLGDLTSLHELVCGESKNGDLTPIGNLTKLRFLAIDGKSIRDLSPLSNLDKLETLNCSSTSISDLSPLINLSKLKELECASTSISGLSPLRNLKTLQSFNCSYTLVSDISPLSNLTSLKKLQLDGTSISDISPLSNLTSLKELILNDTSVSDLAPLSKLTSLNELCLNDTSVSDLLPLRNLTSLKGLAVRNTSISDLSPVGNLTALQTIHCDNTLISDLFAFEKLVHLRELHIGKCQLHKLDMRVWSDESLSLKKLFAFESVLPDVPSEVLSKTDFDDCLPRLRAHLADNASGTVRLKDAKVMVLGNGRVGKTQLCRWLRKLPFDETVPSTHGVTITSIALPSKPETQLHLWDFGGQDIYHATHALFLRSRAVFMIAWTPALENSDSSNDGGRVHGNYPLAYWLDYVHQFSGPNAPLIIVQTQCDSRADDAVLDVAALERLQRFRRQEITVFSAKEMRRGGILLELIDEACNEMASPLIGVSRFRVKRYLESLRDKDVNEKDLDKRLNRTMSRVNFDILCQNMGGIFDTEFLAEFLHDCGTVFYKKGLFGDQLIIDQAWALEAIYTVFHREGCLAVLEAEQGLFTRSLLGALLWNHQGLSELEQSELIQMMTSCGICFEYQPSNENYGIEARYIAPDLLPTEPPMDIYLGWDDQISGSSESFIFPFLTSTLLRSILSAIGSRANLSAHYWKNGVYFYDVDLLSRAMIVQTWTGEWSGEIQVLCQAGNAEDLMFSLVDLIFDKVERLGFKPSCAPDRSRSQQLNDRPEPVSIHFGRESTTHHWYVSYARSDAQFNANLVDRFCDHAREHRVQIQRDEVQLALGGKISKFMDELAEGERIYIFLSEAYLKSIFCMTELHGIWQRCQSDEERFTRRVRVYLSDDLAPGDTTHMLAIRYYWQQKLQEFDEIPLSDTSPRMRARINQIDAFAQQTYDILDVIYDRVQFREETSLFEDITRGKKYG